MRVTKEMLLKIAENTVKERVETEQDLIGVYLTGSLITDNPLVGESSDIDLVFIHENGPEEREFVRLTEDVHIDIQHYPRSKFEPARALRSDPWLGTALFTAKPMYDPKHQIDFIQAGVRGMFHQPEYILARSEPFLDAARQTWISFHNDSQSSGIEATASFLKALENIANAVSCLVEKPLSPRNFLSVFQDRCKTVGKPGLYFGMLGLMGVNQVSQQEISAWLPAWEETFDNLSEARSVADEVHPHRKQYYLKAINYYLSQSEYHYATWPLLNTWAIYAKELHPGDPLSEKWEDITKKLNLSGDGFALRLEGLDAYLDTVEEIFENWKKAHGIQGRK